jgi:prepilin-type N-terminal cleavage/methylation domain-containing protein
VNGWKDRFEEGRNKKSERSKGFLVMRHWCFACFARQIGFEDRQRRRPAAGFTLVELILTLTLLGIVLGMAVPAVQGWWDNSNLKSAARTLSSDIAYMKEAALSSGRAHEIAYSIGTNQCTLRWDSTGGGAFANVPNYAALRNLSDFGSNVRITNVSQSPIRFSSSGAINPSGTVVITNNRGSTATITTLFIGRSHVTYSMQ